MTRQRLWQLRRLERGLCSLCGYSQRVSYVTKTGKTKLSPNCARCFEWVRIKRHARYGCRTIYTAKVLLEGEAP